MCIQSNSRTRRVLREKEAIRLSPQADFALREAMSQMDLLLQAPHVDAGLQHLVCMLQHLQTLRREIV